MREKVLIDLRYLKNLYNGFGQLALSYGTYLKDHPDEFEDLDITLLVRPDYVGKFGSQVKYLKTNALYKTFPFLMPRYDVWHSITQTARYFSIDEGCSRIMTIHDLNFMYEKSPKKLEKRLRRLQADISMCDLITVISNFTKQEVEKHLSRAIQQIPLKAHFA